jgi:hypothetical protein
MSRMVYPVLLNRSSGTLAANQLCIGHIWQ